MESADLRVFQMVAREGSVTKAAGRLGYVQSNITARIQQLESELQTVLFFRHNRGMSLTSNGKTLLAYADKIVGLLDEAVLAMSSSAEPSGPLLIGSTQTAAAVRLPKLLAFYYEQHSNVQLSLTTGHSQFLIEKVLRYELDGAFIGCSYTHPDLQSIPAYEEELVVAAGPHTANLIEALMKPILVFSPGCSYRDVLEQWLQSIGTPHPVIMEFGMLEAIIGGVSAGLGISLMPKAVTQKHEAEGLIRTFAIPQPYRFIKTEFITRKDAFVSSSLNALIGMIPGDSGA
ncbi:LysR family transcriptional regulator [Paenibacillus planticolens]|uniref:LysR family transcriptional regulator n=1 Tax=Paenibacillus planticolens TaxID=2654976 RepID=A0ABX1ZLG5_9BACL|nr:LysR family transcriptional regulator [Paenibacillus planticolens]NOV00939.1 LysR family transcriptional regulator [Paenibacillus planticolens]